MIAIIDGDVLCYQACYWVWEQRLKDAKQLTAEVKTLLMDDEGDFVAPEMTKEQETKYLMRAWKEFEKVLQNVCDKLYCDEFIMAVKGDNNFRNLMYPEYKLNRHIDPSKRNVFVPILRKLAVHQGLAIESEGCEADDLMRIWAEEAMAAGDPFVICTIDKDLKCIPGNHFNLSSMEMKEVSKEEARSHYYEQLLKGDPVDNIPGVPGIGKVKASKLIAACSTEDEMREAVVGAYLAAYDEDWYNYLLSNGKMIHLQKTPTDYFSIRSWPIVQELT